MSTNSLSTHEEFSIKKIIGPMLAVIVGMIMVILDSTVVNVALPKLVEEFNSTISKLQWSVTGYTLALSAVIPLAGWMTDRFGTKRIFLITIGFFTVGSLLCAMAQTPEQLILFRIIQGLGGGMVSPIGMAMIFKMAPPEKRGTLMGMLGIPMLLAPALGPVLAGYLVEYVHWNWIFLINLPIGILAILIGLRNLPKSEVKAVPSLDLLGMILAPIAFSMLAFGVSEGGVEWTSPRTLTGLIVGGTALLLFIIVELRSKQPLLELRVFRSSDFTRGILISWVTQIALFGSILLIPLFLQSIKQYTALETGLILLPQALSSAIFMPLGGRLYDKLGARPLAIAGLSVITAALFMLSKITLDTGLPYIMTALAMVGAGMGMSMMAINTHVLASAPRHLVGRVTPLTTAAQQVMVSFAVAGLTGYWTSRVTSHMTETANQAAAATSAFGDTFLLASGIALVGALLGFILRKPKPKPDDTSKGEGNAPDPAMMMGH